MQGKLNDCVDLLINTKRLPEAALFARTYIPSEVSRVVALWKESLGKVSHVAFILKTNSELEKWESSTGPC